MHIKTQTVAPSARRTRLLIIIAVLTLCGVGALGRMWVNGRAAEHNLINTLSNAEAPHLTMLQFSGQRRAAVCRNRAALEYLEQAMRTRSWKDMTPGMPYTVRITFADGRTFTTSFGQRRDSTFAISVPSTALEGRFPTHHIRLVPPMPKEVDELVSFLLDGSSAGQYLVVDEDGTRRGSGSTPAR